MRGEGRSGDAEEDVPRGLRLRAWLVALGATVALGALASPSRAANPCLTAADRAQDLRAAGRLKEARASLVVCAQKTCNAVVRADCERWLRAVDEDMPTVVVRAVDARGHDVLGASVSIDDAPAPLDGTSVALDPGSHVVRARAAGGETVSQRVLVALGEKARVLELRFAAALDTDGQAMARRAPTAPPPAPPSEVHAARPSVAPYVLLGIAGVGLGAFGYFELSGHSAYSDLENGCYRTRSCTAADTDPVKEKFLGAGVALGVSLVALAAAGIVYLAGRPAHR